MFKEFRGGKKKRKKTPQLTNWINLRKYLLHASVACFKIGFEKANNPNLFSNSPPLPSLPLYTGFLIYDSGRTAPSKTNLNTCVCICIHIFLIREFRPGKPSSTLKRQIKHSAKGNHRGREAWRICRWVSRNGQFSNLSYTNAFI